MDVSYLFEVEVFCDWIWEFVVEYLLFGWFGFGVLLFYEWEEFVWYWWWVLVGVGLVVVFWLMEYGGGGLFLME